MAAKGIARGTPVATGDRPPGDISRARLRLAKGDEQVKKIAEYDVKTHGQDAPDYFQGHGIALTHWEDCATGIGGTEQEALEDALESLAQAGWDTSNIHDKLDDKETAQEDLYWHVSVDVKG